MTNQHTACPLDCPDTCTIDVHVDEGRVTKLTGNSRSPHTQGFLCSKVGRFDRHVYSEERLLEPAIRSGPKGSGEFRNVTWDEALDRIATELRTARDAHGGESILPLYYGGSNGLLTQGSVDERMFRRLGASRLLRTVCATATGAAVQGLYGTMVGTALPDIVHARLIVLWGVNPSVTGIHAVPYIHQAKTQGAKLLVVDPRATPLAKQADLHLAPRPGTDLPVALSMIKWLFDTGNADLEWLAEHATGSDELRERACRWPIAEAAEVSGVAATDIERFVELYAQASPALIRAGWGSERNRNGGSATAAILALPAVAGKFGVRGGGYTLSNSKAFGLDATKAANTEPRATREINMNRVGQELLARDDPAIRCLFVYNHNPLATLPNQEQVRRGLSREDLFTVVYDQVLTDTARYADVLLPATTFLEHHELRRGYGATVVNRSAPVIAPVGRARPNYEVFAELCDRLELSRVDDPRTPAELEAAILDGHPHAREIAGALDATGTARFDQVAGGHPVPFVDSFPRTGDRKVHLVPRHLDAEAPHGLYTYQDDPATDDYPLALISPSTSRTVSSSFGQLIPGEVAVEIHADDAIERGIEDGAAVEIYNDLGRVRCSARISEDVRRGTLSLPKGLWCRHTRSGTTANAVSPDTLTDIGAGACFNDARVEIRRDEHQGTDIGRDYRP